jgi:predicted DNA-binding protein
MPKSAQKARLIRFCNEQDAALRDLSERTNKSVQKLVREAVEAYTHVPDTARSQPRRSERKRTRKSKT